MHRLTFRLTAALLTFIIGITAASLWFVFRRPSSPAAKPEVNSSVQLPAKSERTYKRGMSGEGATGAPGASFITLESSDGMRFTKWSTDYESPKRANSELQRKLKKALGIVNREPAFDENGQRIGEKVLATFSPNNRDAGPASLLWTEGSELFQVDSSSVQNILEYRKDFNH